MNHAQLSAGYGGLRLATAHMEGFSEQLGGGSHARRLVTMRRLGWQVPECRTLGQ